LTLFAELVPFNKLYLLFYYRASFFHRWLEILDMIIVVVSFILTLAFSLLTLEEHGYAK